MRRIVETICVIMAFLVTILILSFLAYLYCWILLLDPVELAQNRTLGQPAQCHREPEMQQGNIHTSPQSLTNLNERKTYVLTRLERLT